MIKVMFSTAFGHSSPGNIAGHFVMRKPKSI